jgi:hypothetical protein
MGPGFERYVKWFREAGFRFEWVREVFFEGNMKKAFASRRAAEGFRWLQTYAVSDPIFTEKGVTHAGIASKLVSFRSRLPEVQPAGNYCAQRSERNLLFVSGQLPKVEGRIAFKGRVGKDLNVEPLGAPARPVWRTSFPS